MKLKNTLMVVVLASIGLMMTNASGGAAFIQQRDRTGSPLSNGSSCATCHSGGTFNPALTVEVRESGNPLTEYIPGTTYELRIKVDAENNPAGYGFQAVALTGDDQVQAGSFGTPPQNTQVTILNDRAYFEHSLRNTENEWAIEWTAPPAGTGEVRIYAAANAANGVNGNNGDSPMQLDNPIVLAEQPSALSEAQRLPVSLSAFPNPTAEVIQLRLSGELIEALQLRLLNATGQVVLQQEVQAMAGVQTVAVSLAELPAGAYIALLTDGHRVASTRIFRQ